MADIQDTTQPLNPTEATDDIQQLSEESMIKVIDEKLKKLERNDFISINISKTGAYVALGLIAVVLWLMPIINYGINQLFGGKFSGQVAEIMPTPSPTPVSTIRIRLGSDSLTEAQAVEQKLNHAGFDQLEFWYDDQINAESVMIATKKEDSSLASELSAVLETDYTMASEAAVLTEDSDFKATILIGKSAKRI